MILIIGGAGQGKLDYVLQKAGCGPAQVVRTLEEARTRSIFAGLEGQPELDGMALLEANPGVILICDKVGCGMVPIEPTQRTRRKAMGRLCYRLTARAEWVERIFCGLPMILKEEDPWN